MAKPIVKWAGGKTQLVPELLSRMPHPVSGTYIEPFAGGAALFFAAAEDGLVRKATLSDINTELMHVYRAVRSDVEGVIEELRHFERAHSKEAYYRERAEFNRVRGDASGIDDAARFIYLNKTCFNGLFRVNQAGEFNVPFGDYAKPCICDANNLRAASDALQNVVCCIQSYEAAVKSAVCGDFVYFDPPYVPVSKTASFTAYAGSFREIEQRKLAATFAELAERGVHAMLSNSDTPLVRELYQDYAIEPVAARRAINSKATKRGAVGEVIVCNWRRADELPAAAGGRA